MPDRPYFILNCAMSADGKIATVTGEARISDEADKLRTHQLRAEVGAILVGSGTVLCDNPRLNVRRCEGTSPVRVVVDSSAKSPSDSHIFDGSVETLLFVTEAASSEKVAILKERCDVILCGKKKVELEKMAQKLYERGIKTVMVEGGGTLNWYMFEADLIDEVRFAIAPVIFGGKDATHVVSGDGFLTRDASVKLELKEMKEKGEMVCLTYVVVRD